MLDTTEAALIEAIRDRPDDPAVRMVHADWLEEHGQQAVADLVRIACDLAALPAGSARREDFRARRSELLAENKARWPVGALGHYFRFAEEMNRPGRLRIDIETYPTHADLLARAFPLADVELDDSIREDEGVLLPDEAFARVAEAPALAGWTALYLSDSTYSPSGLGILLSSPHLTRLRVLDMFESFSGDNVFAWINVPRWPPLSKLHLNGVVQGDERTAALLRSGHLRKLTELSLIYSDIGDSGAEAIADSADLAGLNMLELYGNPIGDQGALALVRSPHLTNLRALDIDSYGETELSPEVQEALRQRFGSNVCF